MFNRHVIGVDVDEESLEIAAINADELEVIRTSSKTLCYVVWKIFRSYLTYKFLYGDLSG